MTTTRPAIDRAHFIGAVEAAILAPSMHNTQPWRFQLVDGTLEVWGDPARQLPVADPHGWGVRLACGAATANAALALAAHGLRTRVEWRPEPSRPYLLARLAAIGTESASPEEVALFRAIPARHTNRHPFTDAAVPAESRSALRAAAAQQGAWLEILVGSQPLELVAEIVRTADRTLRQEPAYTEELASLIGEVAPTGTGVPRYAAGLAPEPGDLLALRDFGGRERGRLVEFEAEPLVAVLGTPGDTGYDHLTAGAALEYTLLTATVHGLAASLLSQPIEVPAARAQLRSGLGRSGMPQLVLRIGYGQPAFATPRRPIAEVIDGPPIG
jgi:nitroreductase